MRLIISLMALLAVSSAWANIGPQGFYRHPNRYFVETGSQGGEGVQKALNAGFQIIHTFDIDPICIKDCNNRFPDDPRVHIWFLDSGKHLYNIIKDIDEPITFWLDGHNGWPDPDGGKNTPLMEELEQIKWHKIKNHTIIIDDLHCCNTALFDFLTLGDIIKKVLEINPDYTITFEPGGNEGEYPANVLVASIPK